MWSLTAKGTKEWRANQKGIWFENRELKGRLRSLLSVWAASFIERGMRELMESLNYVQTISQNMCSVIVHIYPRVAVDLILCTLYGRRSGRLPWIRLITVTPGISAVYFYFWSKLLVFLSQTTPGLTRFNHSVRRFSHSFTCATSPDNATFPLPHLC